VQRNALAAALNSELGRLERTSGESRIRKQQSFADPISPDKYGFHHSLNLLCYNAYIQSWLEYVHDFCNSGLKAFRGHDDWRVGPVFKLKNIIDINHAAYLQLA